ncbi:MAG: hypothetical protein KA450_01430 [Bacteroidia bacterium]|nr:hypothetical protein [Bacteroidota bacterium]MBP6412079.1 hypothetical protein [Bacteroidia bacterium]
MAQLFGNRMAESQTFDHISINDDFWAQLKPHLLSCGFKFLPPKVHFTIGFDERTTDINLHVTKNVSDSKNKPKITVVKIEKRTLEEDAIKIVQKLYRKILKPVNVEELVNKYDYALGFVPLPKIDDIEKNAELEKLWIDGFKDLIKVKRSSRLKIEGDILKRIEGISSTEDVQSLTFKNMVEFSEEAIKNVPCGTIITKEGSMTVVSFKGKCYIVQLDSKFIDLISLYIPKDLAKRLIYNTKRAIILMKNANSYDEIKHLDRPCQLIRTS